MSVIQNTNIKIICPECDSPINQNQPIKLGLIIECKICGTECEIVNMDPLKLAPLEEEK
jgi:lysine biosynthesis protein LysW